MTSQAAPQLAAVATRHTPAADGARIDLVDHCSRPAAHHVGRWPSGALSYSDVPHRRAGSGHTAIDRTPSPTCARGPHRNLHGGTP